MDWRIRVRDEDGDWSRWYYVSVTYGIRWQGDIHHYMISRDMFR